MSLEDKQKAIYNAMMLLDGIDLTISSPDGEGRGVIIFKSGFWDSSGKLAVKLQKNSELKRAKEQLTKLQLTHTKEQAQLQQKINLLQVK